MSASHTQRGGQSRSSKGGAGGQGNQLLVRKKLQDLVSEVAPGHRVDPEVEEVLLELVNDFVEQVTMFSCQLAQHRNSDLLEMRDIALHLERHYNIRIPGFPATDIARPFRRQPPQQEHLERLDKVRASVEQAAAEARKAAK